MRLVEADTEGPNADVEDGPRTPPRPERRRVSVSLIFTLFVLASIVITIYTVFPPHHNAVMEAAVTAHREKQDFELENLTQGELIAWGVAVLGRDVPWPESDAEVEILGVRTFKLLRRKGALVRYRIAKDEVSVLVQRARDTPPRKHKRQDGDHLCVSWRKTKWTFTAVGPLAGADRWMRYVGAPSKFLSQRSPDN